MSTATGYYDIDPINAFPHKWRLFYSRANNNNITGKKNNIERRPEPFSSTFYAADCDPNTTGIYIYTSRHSIHF